MNIDRMKRVIKRIEEAPDSKFEMRYFVNHCGTSMCIAGHTCLEAGMKLVKNEVFPDFVDKDNNVIDPQTVAKDYLGLDEYMSDQIFLGRWSDKTMDEITKEEALNYLRNLVQGNAK